MRRLDDRSSEQPELALARAAQVVDIPLEVIRRQRGAGAALSLACSASGLDDKEIYLSLKIDPGHFSRMKKGDAGFPPDMLADFCTLVHNTIYPEWMASQIGCTLTLIETEAERRAKAAEARAQAAEQENRLMRQLLAGMAAA